MPISESVPLAGRIALIAEPAILELADVSTGYLDEPVVRDFSLAVPHGSITTLVGANGARKSTLLRAIYGLNRHFGSSIRFAGKEI